MQIDPQVGIAKRRWLALRRSEVEALGRAEDVAQFDQAWRLWTTQYLKKLEKLKNQNFELYQRYIMED